MREGTSSPRVLNPGESPSDYTMDAQFFYKASPKGLTKYSHGKESAYGAGCRCTPCCDVKTRAQKRRDWARHNGLHDPMVDAKEVSTHLAMLQDNGMSVRQIESASGVSQNAIIALRKQNQQRCHKSTADKLMAVMPGVATFIEIGYVDASLTSYRFNSLRAVGFTARRILMATGNWKKQKGINRMPTDKVTVDRAIRTREVFLKWQLGPYPDRNDQTQDWHVRAGISRNIMLGERNGWPKPFEWDDPGTLVWPEGYEGRLQFTAASTAFIDDLAVVRALSGVPTELTRAERGEAYRRLAESTFREALFSGGQEVDPRIVRAAHGIGMEIHSLRGCVDKYRSRILNGSIRT